MQAVDHRGAISAASPLSRGAPPGRRNGGDGRERFRRHGRADAGPHLHHRISRAVGGWPPGQAGRRLPQRPAERRPVDDLQLLRRRARLRARASAPTSSSTISSARRAPACLMSISAIGSKARPAWPTRPASGRSDGSAVTAGGAWMKWSERRQTREPFVLPTRREPQALTDRRLAFSARHFRGARSASRQRRPPRTAPIRDAARDGSGDRTE